MAVSQVFFHPFSRDILSIASAVHSAESCVRGDVENLRTIFTNPWTGVVILIMNGIYPQLAAEGGKRLFTALCFHPP